MAKSLTERLQEDEENIVDRRQVSDVSRREIAEYIYHDNSVEAIKKLFKIVTGEEVTKYPPVRNVKGNIIVDDSVIKELDGKNYRIDVNIDGETRTSVITDSDSEYIFRDYEDGTYDISVQGEEVVYEYAEDDMERTEYKVESSEIKTQKDSVTVDTSETDFGSTIEGPDIYLESISIGDEIKDE